jgi:putative ABC transport system substrate-binding protein
VSRLTCLRSGILAAAFLSALLPLGLEAQAPARKCVGILIASPDPAERYRMAFIEGMRELGYAEGANICYDFRPHEGSRARMEQDARELASAKVPLILTMSTPATLAAKNATGTIPIVFTLVGDPLGAGLVRSLSAPGGNVTGFSLLNPGLRAKRVEILHDIAPKLKRIGVLYDPAQAKIYQATLSDVEQGAKAYGKELLFVPASRPQEFDDAFSKLEAWRPEAFMLLESGLFHAHRKPLLERATRNRWPSVTGTRAYAEAGGLVSYGVDYADLSRRSASYVVRILKGAKPADLPVQQAERFELVINMKVAKAIGLAVPRHMLLRADHVIE